jgi:hypothetical protein
MLGVTVSSGRHFHAPRPMGLLRALPCSEAKGDGIIAMTKIIIIINAAAAVVDQSRRTAVFATPMI